VHFYAGLFAVPFLVLMSLTGLVILYTQPIRDFTQDDLRTVVPVGEWTSFDAQEQAVEARYPTASVVSMTLPTDRDHSTIFGLDSGVEVFVDPYTAEVLGRANPDGGIVGFANRLHGSLNSFERMISLPTVSALWDGGPVMRDYVIGDLVLEVLGVWTLVLALSGMFLWWPRKSANRERQGRGLLRIRLAKKGRGRWRDLHAVSGVVLFPVLVVTLISGFAWSAYWGPNFTALANEISPNDWPDAPPSGQVTRADLDRLGNHISWNTGGIPIPNSYATEPDGTQPAPLSLDSVVAIGELEGMKPGYAVYFPANDVDEAGNPIYGTFTLSNSWPRKTGEARDVSLDQFTGERVQEVGGFGYGAVSYSLDSMVSWHMGTQWGLASRIFMTLLCVLVIWSSFSAVVMYWKRRRNGSLGLPRRPVDVRLGKQLTIVAVALGIVFPQWAVTAIIVLLFDKFVIRRVPRLRAVFGQR
jgi:uncharacterized iron-regulated membrane protein